MQRIYRIGVSEWPSDRNCLKIEYKSFSILPGYENLGYEKYEPIKIQPLFYAYESGTKPADFDNTLNVKLYYKKNNGQWNEWIIGTEITLNATDTLYFFGRNNQICKFYNHELFEDYSYDFYKYLIFNFNEPHEGTGYNRVDRDLALSGCISALFTGSNKTVYDKIIHLESNWNGYKGMFINDTWSGKHWDISGLVINAERSWCSYMFYDWINCHKGICSLPATDLVPLAYYEMFGRMQYYVDLYLPKLEATTLPEKCYSYMFGIQLSTTQTAEYQYEYKIPFSEAAITVASDALECMFKDSREGYGFLTPQVNTTYYSKVPIK